MNKLFEFPFSHFSCVFHGNVMLAWIFLEFFFIVSFNFSWLFVFELSKFWWCVQFYTARRNPDSNNRRGTFFWPSLLYKQYACTFLCMCMCTCTCYVCALIFIVHLTGNCSGTNDNLYISFQIFVIDTKWRSVSKW